MRSKLRWLAILHIAGLLISLSVLSLGCTSTITKSAPDIWTASMTLGNSSVQVGTDETTQIKVSGGEVSAEGAGIVSRALSLLSSFLPPVVSGGVGGP